MTTETAHGPYVGAARRLVVVPGIFVFVFTVWPAIATLRRGFDVTATITESGLRETVWFTAWQAAASTTLTLVIGLPIAWVLSRHEFTGRRIVRALTLVPFVLPTLVVGLAFRAVLPADLRTGVFPLIVAHVFLNVAVVVRIVGARWESQPRTFDDAAATLGAGPVARFRTVTWPMLRGSIGAGAGLVFMYCFTTYGAARVLAGPSRPVTETEIYRFAVLAGDMRAASALAVAQVVLVGIVLALTSRGFTHASAPTQPLALRTAPRARRIGVAVGASLIATVFMLPLVGLVSRSLRVGDGFSLAAWRCAGLKGSAASMRRWSATRVAGPRLRARPEAATSVPASRTARCGTRGESRGRQPRLTRRRESPRMPLRHRAPRAMRRAPAQRQRACR